MSEAKSFFTDGAAYDRLMGRWSRAAGEEFLDWLSPPQGLHWLDVGCGTGVFTGLVVERCAPGAISAIDPSPDQIAFARTRPIAERVAFHVGDALSLPFDDGAFDVAAMALVLSFVPDCAKAAAEMARVVRPGGVVASYNWDVPAGGFPQQPLREALAQMGVEVRIAGAPESYDIDLVRRLFTGAGLVDVAVRPIEVRLSYADFDALWEANTALANPFVQPILNMSADEVARLKGLLSEILPAGPDGRITHGARANAVKGRVPR